MNNDNSRNLAIVLAVLVAGSSLTIGYVATRSYIQKKAAQGNLTQGVQMGSVSPTGRAAGTASSGSAATGGNDSGSFSFATGSDSSTGATEEGWHVDSQQQKTLKYLTPPVIPTTIPEHLLDCGYGPGEQNCVASNPKTCAYWKESEVLAAFKAPSIDKKLRVWYADEWPLTLGSGSVSPITKSPDHVVNPMVGDLAVVDSAGRPFPPMLFITDITNNPADRSGDWENGGIGFPPSEVFGTWKSLGGSNINPNYTVLGAGSDPPPEGVNDKYVSEIVWDLSDPKYTLIANHIYRLEFMLHDGDREGDSGERCAIAHF